MTPEPLPAASTRPLYNRLMGVPLRVGVIALILLCTGVGIYWMVDRGPRESDRVTHPSGYSIICPGDWFPKMTLHPTDSQLIDGMMLSPKSWKGLEPSMWVNRLAAPPDPAKLTADGFRQDTFLGQPAWLKQSKLRQYTIRSVTFESNNQWYNAGVSLPGWEGARLDDWWRYIQSFRPSPAQNAQPSQPRP